MEMANLKTWLEAAEKRFDEPILSMVVGKHYDRTHEAPLQDENIILTREAGLAKIDQEFDEGYGGADCYPLFAWTRSRIFFIHEYDGAVSLHWVPRFPTEGEPDF